MKSSFSLHACAYKCRSQSTCQAWRTHVCSIPRICSLKDFTAEQRTTLVVLLSSFQSIRLDLTYYIYKSL